MDASILKVIGIAAITMTVVAPGRSIVAQQGDNNGELVVGTYHFATSGSMRYVEQLQNQTNTYTDKEESEWNLRFY